MWFQHPKVKDNVLGEWQGLVFSMVENINKQEPALAAKEQKISSDLQ
jgi:hypothetical protein